MSDIWSYWACPTDISTAERGIVWPRLSGTRCLSDCSLFTTLFGCPKVMVFRLCLLPNMTEKKKFGSYYRWYLGPPLPLWGVIWDEGFVVTWGFPWFFHFIKKMKGNIALLLLAYLASLTLSHLFLSLSFYLFVLLPFLQNLTVSLFLSFLPLILV